MKTNTFYLKSALTFIVMIVTISACTEKETDKKETQPSAGAENYAYTIKKPDNWEIGSTDNTRIVLKSLKAWEEGKMDESIKYFGDTIRVQFDGIDKKMPKDSLKAMFTSGWNSYKTVRERMTDWESVISKDKSEEWVTLWYTQSWETKNGVKDSSAVINDAQIKDGKIIRLSEYNRKLH